MRILEEAGHDHGRIRDSKQAYTRDTGQLRSALNWPRANDGTSDPRQCYLTANRLHTIRTFVQAMASAASHALAWLKVLPSLQAIILSAQRSGTTWAMCMLARACTQPAAVVTSMDLRQKNVRGVIRSGRLLVSSRS